MGKVIKEEDLRLNIIVNGNDTRQKIGELSRSVEDLNTKNSQLEAQRKKLRAEGKKDSQQYKDLTAQINTNKATIKGYQQQIISLRSSMKVSEMTMDELQQRAKQLNAQLRHAAPGTKQYAQLSKSLREVNVRMSELKAQTRGVSGVMDKLGLGKLQAVIGKLFVYYQVIRGFFKIFSGGIKTIKDFEQANVNLSTILGVSVSQMAALTKSALELGRTTEYTASQVTNLQTELAKLGFGQQAILQMQKPILQFATAVGAELPEAAALAGATLRAFDKDASDTDEVLATMAVGCNKSALSFNYLQESMSIVAPVAKTFGFGIKDVVTLLGTLANSGFDASSAATATRNILLNLADANGKLAKALGKPVHTLPELIDGLQQLAAKGINLSKTLELTDKRSVAAFNTFLHGVGTMTGLRDAVENVDGELKRIQEERLNSVEGSIKLMKSAWEGFVLTMYDSRGTIKTVIDWLTAGINGINDLMLGEAGRRTRGDETVASSINKTVTTQFKTTFDSTDGKTTDEKIEQTIEAVKEKLQKRMYENWEGIVDKDFINKAISDGLQQAADFIREAEDKKQDQNKRAKKQKQQEAAAAAYKALDEKEIAERTAIKKKYLAGEIASEEEYNAQLLQLNINALSRRLKSGELKGKERLTAEEQLTTLLLQQKKQEQDKLDKIEAERIKSLADATERENAEYALRCRKAQGNAQLLEQLAAQHKRNLAKIQLDKINTSIQNDDAAYKRERQSLKSQQASELLAFTGTADEKKKLRKQHLEELAALDAQYATAMSKKLQELLDNGNFEGLSLDDAVLSDEEKDKLTQKLLDVKELLASLDVEMENLHTGELNAVGTTDLLGFSLDDWNTLFTNLKDGKVGVQEIAMAMKAMTEVYATYDKIATVAENRQLNQFKKNNDIKKKDLERRLDLGLINQEQYNAKSEQLDEEYDAKQEEIQLKQARRQKALSITSAIINTAVGATAAYDDAPWPFNLILAAMISAMGAVQVGLIASQPVAGAEEGGVMVTRAQDGKKFKASVEPNKRGYVEKPTVITGENGFEYIIPNEAMQNPTARPIIDIFETVRRQGKLADFDFNQILPALYTVPGRARGGSLTATGTETFSAETLITASGVTDPALYTLLYTAIVKLTEKLDDPLHAYVTMLGKNGIIEKMSEYERAKKRGKLGQ